MVFFIRCRIQQTQGRLGFDHACLPTSFVTMAAMKAAMKAMTTAKPMNAILAVTV